MVYQFELSPEQADVVSEPLGMALYQHSKGLPGIVLGQIGEPEPRDGKVYCTVRFIPNEATKRIIAVLKEEES